MKFFKTFKIFLKFLTNNFGKFMKNIKLPI